MKNVITAEMNKDLQEIRNNLHITNFKNTLFDERQQVVGSCRPDYDVAPDIKTTSAEVKQMILKLAFKYIKQVDVDQDDGFSFAYQLSLLFPQRFQILVIQSTFQIYDAFAGQNENGNRFNKHKFSQMPRVDPNVFRDVATNQNLVPNEETLTQEITEKGVKIIRLKASPWIEYVTIMPTVPEWQRRQDALLSSQDNPVDSMLRGAIDFLDINDLASVNLILAESSSIHVELAENMKKLRKREQNSKLKMNVQVKQFKNLTNPSQFGQSQDAEEQIVEQDVYQVVSATNLHEKNNNMYVQMSNILTGANIVEMNNKDKNQKNKRIVDQDNQKTKPPSKSSLLNLQSNLIQSLNTLRYMNSREAKIKILYTLNYFRSIQKRLMIDLREFGTRERAVGDVIDPLIPAEEADNQLIDTYNMVLANTNKIRLMTEQSNNKRENDSDILSKSKLNKNSESLLDESDRDEALKSIKKLKEQEKKAKFAREIQDQNQLDINFQLLPPKAINSLMTNDSNQGVGLVDLKKYRRNGHFHEKHSATCPILPRFHATFGEPSEIQPDYVEADREAHLKFISLDSMRFLNRVDHIEIDEGKQEVFVRDDFNIYIMYECSLTDMQILELELLRIGSYYISKLEELYDTEVDKVCHKKDRQQVLNDLLNHELEFQFRKVLLAQLYMEAYEHVCDPVEQHRLIKIIIDLISRRPRLNLDSFYFKDSYKAEIDCINNNIKLFDIIISSQIQIEKHYNTNLHEQLNLSYSLAQAKQKHGWTFQNADYHLQDLIDKFRQQEHQGQIQVNYNDNDDSQSDTNPNENNSATDQIDPNQTSTQNKETQSMSTQKQQNQLKKPKYMRNMRYIDHELDPDAFTRLLDLPKVTVEHLFNQNKENDEILMDIMAEESHFVHLIEGYPDLMSLRQSGKANEQNAHRSASVSIATQKDKSVNTSNRPDLTFSQPDQVQELQIKLNKWLKRQRAMSIMDFYSDALGFVSKLQATITQCMHELEDALRPHDNMMRSLLESVIFEKALIEFREIQNIMIGNQIEYRGREYIEDESTVGSADNMLFRLREFHSSFTSQTKITQNPFLMAKLDLSSIKQIKFPPRIKISQNPYVRKQDLLEEGKHVSIAIAEHKFKKNPTSFMRHYLRGFEDELLTRTSVLPQSDLKQQLLKLKPPKMLQMTCNTIEFLRLRSELILCLSECAVLQQIYIDQVSQCNQHGYKPIYQEGLAFENGIVPQSEINYVDDGPGHMLDLEMAINEVDKTCASNLNFRNPDSFKMMTLKSGLEELRLVVHYQMMQKQALIVATRINQSILDTHLLALQELQVIEKFQFATPNMIIPVENCFGLGQPQQIERPKLNRVRNFYKSELVGIINLLVVPISGWKGSQRTNLGKKYQEMVALCEKNFQHKEVKLRALRSFKVSLFNQYCNLVLEQIHADSLKYNMIVQCQKLRNLNQYFQFNPATMNITTHDANQYSHDPGSVPFAFSQLFKLESSDLKENGSFWYSIQNYKDQIFEELKKNKSKNQDIQSLSKLSNYQVELPNSASIDYKKREQLDIFSIPSTRKILQMNVFESQDERNKFSRSSLEEIHFDFDENQFESNHIFNEILPSPSLLEESNQRLNLNDYSKIKYVQILRYFQHVENLIQLELSISKFSFNSDLVAELDNCMQTGKAFFQSRFPLAPEMTNSPCSGDLVSIINSGRAYQNLEVTEQGKQLQEDQNRFQQINGQRNKLAIKILRKLFERKRQKADIGEELYHASQRIKETLIESRKHGEKFETTNNFSCEYLAKFEHIRYLQIVSTLMKMNEYFLSKMQVRAGKAIQNVLLALSARDHIQIMQTNGSANINSADVHSSKMSIEPASLCSYFDNKYEQLNFQRCICPILSDRALEPQEITLLQSIFLNNSEVSATNGQEGVLIKPTAFKCLPFVGSAQKTMVFQGSDLEPLQSYLLCLDNSQRQYITSNFRQMDSLLEDYLCHIVNETLKEGEINPSIKPLTYQQLKQSKRFLTDQIDSRQLKLAILCFMAHEIPSKLMDSPQVTKQIEDMYKKQLLWKILKEKDIQKNAQEARYRSNLAIEDMIEAQNNLEQEINRLEKMDERKITDEDVSRVQKLKIKQLEQEHLQMRRNVLLDSILFNRSSTVVIQQEIERILIKAAIDTLNNECSALSTCLKNQAKEIEAYIHPFQQFAVTLYDKVDPLSHLDPINKCSQIQLFLTRLKNRGTEVETLTSGPGYVFTLKDINDCVATLTKGLLKYSEQEMRTRCELFAKKEQHLYNLLYVKDQQLEQLQTRMDRQIIDIEKLVNARIYEKGNIIVFELDQVNRQMKLLKDNMFLLEQRIYKEIEDQFKNKIVFKDSRIDRIKDQFTGYKNEILKQQDALIAQRRDFIERELGLKDKDGREIRKGRIPMNFIENQTSPGKYLMNRNHNSSNQNNFVIQTDQVEFNPIQDPKTRDQLFEQIQKTKQMIKGEGQKQFVDDVNQLGQPYQMPSQLQDLKQLDEAEARIEVARYVERMRLMYLFWKVKEVTLKQRFENQIYSLNQKVSSNSMLWEQLAESEKREQILRQELVMTQQSLNNTQLIVDKQKDTIKKLDTENTRLMNFKHSKGKRLDELEKKVTQYELFQKIDVDKLIQILHKQQQELVKLRRQDQIQSNQLQNMYRQNKEDLRNVERKYNIENQVKNSVIERLEQTRQQMKVLEVNNGSVAAVWKQKCAELADICQLLQQENETLNNKTQHLANVTVNLLGTLNEYNQVQSELANLQDSQTRFDTTQAQGLMNQRSQSQSKRFNAQSTVINESSHGMSLPKLNSTSQYAGQLLNDEFRNKNQTGSSLNQSKRNSIDKQKLSGLQQVNNQNFTASHEFKNRHLIFKNQEMNKGNLNQVKKRGGHNRGRSLLEIQKEFERESRIGKLQKVMAEQYSQNKGDYLQQNSFNQQSLSTQIQKSEYIEPKHQKQLNSNQRDLIQQMHYKNRQNFSKAMSLSRELKDSLLESSIYSIPHRIDLQNSLIQTSITRSPMGQYQNQLFTNNDYPQNQKINKKQSSSGLLSRRSQNQGAKQSVPESQLVLSEKDNIRMYDEQPNQLDSSQCNSIKATTNPKTLC